MIAGVFGKRLAGKRGPGITQSAMIDQRHPEVVLLTNDDRHRGPLDGGIHLVDQRLERIRDDLDRDRIGHHEHALAPLAASQMTATRRSRRSGCEQASTCADWPG